MRQLKLSIRNGILFVFILILLASAAAKLPARAENASSMENAPLVHAKLKGPSNLKIKTKLKTATLSWDPDPSPYCSGYAIYLCKAFHSTAGSL